MMTEIVLTSDQSQLFSQAIDGVVLCDTTGKVIARIPPVISDEEKAIIAEAKRRLASDEPRVPFSDVLKRLKEREKEGETQRP
jgi:hypothetical protein